ncbi:hypothetical protein [Desulfobacter sp.]
MDLAPVKESPLNLNTAYKYHSIKKYPALLFKVAGRLMVDMDEYHNMAKQAKEAQRVHSGLTVKITRLNWRLKIMGTFEGPENIFPPYLNRAMRA